MVVAHVRAVLRIMTMMTGKLVGGERPGSLSVGQQQREELPSGPAGRRPSIHQPPATTTSPALASAKIREENLDGKTGGEGKRGIVVSRARLSLPSLPPARSHLSVAPHQQREQRSAARLPAWVALASGRWSVNGCLVQDS